MSSNGRSNDIAVSVRGLSKSYTIAHNSEKHTTLTEAMLHRFKNPAQRAETETFWALRDVEFDIKKGDVVGIIGRNGAGKSTLLKILSQITEPTTGEINLYGRVGSLLEVGTGFHPELTGRENIFLNGAILGMRKSEIQRQFDAIVEFAGVEKFLDTPVKRYSSGMYVRLAFAVAAHLQSDILIVDEVLAVGDAAFQQRCLGKMQDVAESGRTVLFVSHNLGSMSRLCNQCIYLKSGEVHTSGETQICISEYLSENVETAFVDLAGILDRKGDGSAQFQSVEIRDAENLRVGSVSTGDTVKIILKIFSSSIINQAVFSIDIKTITGTPVLHLVSSDQGFFARLPVGKSSYEVVIAKLGLYPGSYIASFFLGTGTGQMYDYINECLKIDILPPAFVQRDGLSWEHAVYFQDSEWHLYQGVG